VQRVASETAKAMRSPDMEKRLAAEGSEPVGGKPQQFAAHLKSEHAQWTRVIKTAGIKGE